FLLNSLANNLVVDMGINPRSSSVLRLGNSDQGGADHPVVKAVAFLKDVDHRVGLFLRRQHADRLVLVGVELPSDGVDFLEAGFPEDRAQLLQSQLDPVLQGFQGRGVRRERRLQAVLDGQQLDGDGLYRVLVRVGELYCGPLADVVRLSLGPEPRVVVLSRLGFGLPQELGGIGRWRLLPEGWLADRGFARGGTGLIWVRHALSAR